jgi:hypothetical protein
MKSSWIAEHRNGGKLSDITLISIAGSSLKFTSRGDKRYNTGFFSYLSGRFQ